MLRMIADRDASINWRAWWQDNPIDYEVASEVAVTGFRR